MATKNKNLSNYNSNDIVHSEGMKFAIIVSEWNSHITEKLYKGSYETLLKFGVHEKDIVRINVPGSFELIFGA